MKRKARLLGGFFIGASLLGFLPTARLPLNQPVDIEFTPNKTGDVAFACGMGMFSGTLVVK